MSAVRGWVLALAGCFAFYAAAGLCLYLAVEHPGPARLVALFLGGTVLGFLVYVWGYAAGNRAGLAWNELEVDLLRRKLAVLRRVAARATAQAEHATAEARAQWSRWEQEMRRG